MVKLTSVRLRALLSYDPATGKFTWVSKPNRRIRVGSEAGTLVNGYPSIGIEGRRYIASRLAWLYQTGEWPKGEIDHNNGQPADCRWDNLRDVTHVVNLQNQRRPHADNSLGVLGVSRCPHGKKFRAQIDGTYIGSFDTINEASLAYIDAKRARHIGGTL